MRTAASSEMFRQGLSGRRPCSVLLFVAGLLFGCCSPACALARYGVGSSRPASISSPADVSTDCQLRALAVEYAAWLQPADAISNWTAAVQSGMEMDVLCPAQLRIPTAARFPPPSIVRRPQATLSAKQLLDGCPLGLRVFVDGNNGHDSANGTQAAAVQTIARGLALLRGQRAAVASSSPACLVLRKSRYYLGTNSGLALAPSAESSSRIGAIALDSADSGLILIAFPGEELQVELSAGALLSDLKWQRHLKLSQGTILCTQLPEGLDLSFRAANELFQDSSRLIRAKFPNSDPSTQGMWTQPTGWFDQAEQWLPPKPHPPVTLVEVSEPNRNGTAFPYFQAGIGGRCEVFDPPFSFWCSDSHPRAAHSRTPRAWSTRPTSAPA